MSAVTRTTASKPVRHGKIDRELHRGRKLPGMNRMKCPQNCELPRAWILMNCVRKDHRQDIRFAVQVRGF